MEEKNKKIQETEFEWDAEEYTYFHKGPGWYATIILLTLVLVGVGIWQANFIFIIFSLLAGGLIIFWGQKEPEQIDFRIANSGVYIGDDIALNYKELEGFDIHHHEHKSNEVIIKKKAHLNPFIKMPAPGDAASKAKRVLSDHLPQEQYDDSTLDHIADWMRF